MIKDLDQAITGAGSVTFVNFHGIKVAEETMLRTELRNAGVRRSACETHGRLGTISLGNGESGYRPSATNHLFKHSVDAKAILLSETN